MITADQLEKFLKDHNVRYERDDNLLFVRSDSAKYNYSANVLFRVHPNSGYIDVVIYSFKFTEITQAVLNLVNKLNKTYRFFSFYIDDDSSLTLEANAIVKENESAKEVVELMMLSCEVLDDCYPDIQRVMWQ